MTRETIAPNHVLGVVGGLNKAREIAQEIQTMGLPEPIIITDENVGERLEEESSMPTRILQRIFNHLSEEIRYLNQYEDAARQGQTVVAVKADDEESVDKATAVLTRHGAVDVRFFGRFAVSDKTPESNPSQGVEGPPTERPLEHS